MPGRQRSLTSQALKILLMVLLSSDAAMICRQDKEAQKAEVQSTDGDDGLRIAWQYRRLLKKHSTASGPASAARGMPSRCAFLPHARAVLLTYEVEKILSSSGMPPFLLILILAFLLILMYCFLWLHSYLLIQPCFQEALPADSLCP